MYGWENAGLMSPWATAWGMQPQTVADTVVREQVAPALGLDTPGETPGFSVGGDPNAATQTSQATRDRVAQSLGNSAKTMAGKTALGAGAALAAGMPASMLGNAVLGGLTAPSTIGGLLGNAVNETLGTTPQGFIGQTISTVPGMALGMLGAGPIGGLVGGLMGGVVSDAVMDGLNARKEEALRDDLESKSGYFGGRTAFADMKTYADRVDKLNAKVADAVAKAAKVAGIAGVTAPSFSPRGLSTQGMEVGGRGMQSYGGWGNVGGPTGGARAVDRSYGPSMGGFAGLGIGNPSSYGGGRDSGRDRGGFGANDGNSDTAGNAGFGR